MLCHSFPPLTSPLLSVVSSESPRIAEAPDRSGRQTAALGSGEKRVSVSCVHTWLLAPKQGIPGVQMGDMCAALGLEPGRRPNLLCHMQQPIGKRKEKVFSSSAALVRARHRLHPIWSEQRLERLKFLENIKQT